MEKDEFYYDSPSTLPTTEEPRLGKMKMSEGSSYSGKPYPSRMVVEIFQNCFLLASKYIGWKNRDAIYRILPHSAQAYKLGYEIMGRIDHLYSRDNDRTLTYRVSVNLNPVFVMLRSSSVNFTVRDIIKKAYARTVADSFYSGAVH